MVANTFDPPNLADAKRIIAETIAHLSNAEIYALADRIRASSKGALFAGIPSAGKGSSQSASNNGS
jgi:hypothetical protein